MHSALDQSSVVVMGELHGTEESPDAFKDAVCAAVQQNYSLTVGIEIPEAAIEAVRKQVLAGGSEGSLSSSPFWMEARDGRSSEASHDLIRYLLQLEKDGNIKLVGFDARVNGREPFGESAGTHIQDFSSNSGRSQRTLLMTGRGHVGFGNDPNSIAAFFAGQGMDTLAVFFHYGGGEAWVCRSGQCGQSFAPKEGGCTIRAAAPSLPADAGLNQKTSVMCLGVVTSSPPRIKH